MTNATILQKWPDTDASNCLKQTDVGGVHSLHLAAIVSPPGALW